jgi:cyclic pyranopterin phosphate synthase
MLRDAFGREIDYLRISVTDRCNLRCVYCMPPQGIEWKARSEILTYEEITTVVRAAAALGIRKVRLTGGEPLVRPDIERLVAMIAAVRGIEDVSLTTNAVLLDRHAESLACAGLGRVNVSLDTLHADRFERITRFGHIDDVWRGLEAAERVGLAPIKLNAVVVRGMNDDELADLAALTLDHAWHVRFIELMPVANEGDWGDPLRVPPPGERLVTAEEMQARLSTQLGIPELFAEALLASSAVPGNGPARVFRLPNAKGTLGFITPVSQHFCPTCNRVRLTADGKLRPCLLNDGEVDVMGALRASASDAEVQALLTRAVENKPERHRLNEEITPTQLIGQRVMAQIGG